MRIAHRVLALSIAVCVPLAVMGCKQEASKPSPPVAAPAPAPAPPPAPKPFRVSQVELGNAIGADKRVSLPKSSFAPADTIYATVVTDGTAESVTLVARWTYGTDAQLVKEDTLMIAPTGPAANEFHISKPDGWPAGKYKVEILANGSTAGTQEFEVVAP